MDKITFISDAPAQRVDRFLSDRLEWATRSTIKRWILGGRLKLNGTVLSKPGRKIETGGLLELHVPKREPLEMKGEDIPIDIVYEDEWLAVINKQPGLVVHPGAGNPDGTLVNAMIYHFDRLSDIEAARPGIVHRLDKDTSGLMIIAKDDSVHWKLSAMIAEKAVKRIYWGITVGNFNSDSGIITAPIGRDRKDRRKMAVVNEGRPAATEYRVLTRYSGFSLTEFSLMTGRTHQIRVHAAFTGHPILGDPVYGGRTGLKPFRSISRQMLHSKRLSFSHPVTGEELSFEVAVWPDMRDVLETLD